jgi:uncharacterized membrane protein YkoI
MRRGTLFVSIIAGIAGAAALSTPALVLARINDPPANQRPVPSNCVAPTPAPPALFIEGEIVQDSHGNKLVVDRQSREVLGIVLEDKPARETKPSTLSSSRVKAANAVALSLLDAIAAAERHSKGGKILEVILEASFKPTVSAATYLLKIYRQGEIWEGRMDANSGAILGEEKASPESWLDVDDKAVLAGLETASTTIVQAVQIAEQHAQGKAIAAEIDVGDGIETVWEIIVITNDQKRKVIVDPATGQVKSS